MSYGGYDALGKILRHLFSNIEGTNIEELQPLVETGWADHGVLQKFSQLEFVDVPYT